jgi:hypothetical protein
MPSVSILGDLGYQAPVCFPLNTATGRFYVKNSGTDTGTILTTSRIVDFARKLHETGVTTGAKPLDVTVHPRLSAMPRFRSLTLAIPIKANFHTSGLQFYLTVAHKTRAAASGAGSTWVTLRTTVDRFKMGTDTDAIANVGVVSSVSAQNMARFYKANITASFKLASSTAAKDTSTNQGGFVVFNPAVILSGMDVPVFVPARVSG